MTNQELLQTACTTKKVRLMQRRAGVRLPVTHRSFYPPTGERRADLWWEAMVMRLQKTDTMLIMGRRFEVGTLLQLEIGEASGNGVEEVLVRVREVKRQETGGYVIHADFLPALPDEVLERLQ